LLPALDLKVPPEVKGGVLAVLKNERDKKQGGLCSQAKDYLDFLKAGSELSSR